MIVQTCNERKPNRTALSVDVESLPSDKIFASETERQIFRPNTVLLLATVNDTETEEASFVHYVANQFRKTDGDKDVFSIFTSIASHMTDENDFSQVHVLCESTLDKYLVLPSLLTGKVLNDAWQSVSYTDVMTSHAPQQSTSFKVRQIVLL